jgi:hypothetical protein
LIVDAVVDVVVGVKVVVLKDTIIFATRVSKVGEYLEGHLGETHIDSHHVIGNDLNQEGKFDGFPYQDGSYEFAKEDVAVGSPFVVDVNYGGFYEYKLFLKSIDLVVVIPVCEALGAQEYINLLLRIRTWSYEGCRNNDFDEANLLVKDTNADRAWKVKVD